MKTPPRLSKQALDFALRTGRPECGKLLVRLGRTKEETFTFAKSDIAEFFKAQGQAISKIVPVAVAYYKKIGAEVAGKAAVFGSIRSEIGTGLSHAYLLRVLTQAGFVVKPKSGMFTPKGYAASMLRKEESAKALTKETKAAKKPAKKSGKATKTKATKAKVSKTKPSKSKKTTQATSPKKTAKAVKKGAKKTVKPAAKKATKKSASAKKLAKKAVSSPAPSTSSQSAPSSAVAAE